MESDMIQEKLLVNLLKQKVWIDLNTAALFTGGNNAECVLDIVVEADDMLTQFLLEQGEFEIEAANYFSLAYIWRECRFYFQLQSLPHWSRPKYSHMLTVWLGL